MEGTNLSIGFSRLHIQKWQNIYIYRLLSFMKMKASTFPHYNKNTLKWTWWLKMMYRFPNKPSLKFSMTNRGNGGACIEEEPGESYDLFHTQNPCALHRVAGRGRCRPVVRTGLGHGRAELQVGLSGHREPVLKQPWNRSVIPVRKTLLQADWPLKSTSRSDTSDPNSFGSVRIRETQQQNCRLVTVCLREL